MSRWNTEDFDAGFVAALTFIILTVVGFAIYAFGGWQAIAGVLAFTAATTTVFITAASISKNRRNRR